MRIQVVRRICIPLGLSSWILCTLPLLTRKAPNELQVGKHFQQWIFLHVLIEPKKALGHAAWTPWKHFLVTFSQQPQKLLKNLAPLPINCAMCSRTSLGFPGMSGSPWKVQFAAGRGSGWSWAWELQEKPRYWTSWEAEVWWYPNLECWIRLGTVGCNYCFHQMTLFQIPDLHVRATLLHMF